MKNSPAFTIDEMVRFKHNGNFLYGRVIEITIRAERTLYLVHVLRDIHDQSTVDLSDDGNCLVSEINLINSLDTPEDDQDTATVEVSYGDRR